MGADALLHHLTDRTEVHLQGGCVDAGVELPVVAGMRLASVEIEEALHDQSPSSTDTTGLYAAPGPGPMSRSGGGANLGARQPDMGPYEVSGALSHTRPGQKRSRARLEDVVAAAAAIVARASLDELTVRAVADELGVNSPAIYHHVPAGRQGLVDLVVDRIAKTITGAAFTEDPGETWLDRIERVVLMISRAAEGYPGVMTHLVSTGSNRDVSLLGADFVARQLIEGGFADRADAAFDAINALISGWTLTRRPSATSCRDGDYEHLASILDRAAPANYDNLRLALRGMLLNLRSHDA